MQKPNRIRELLKTGKTVTGVLVFSGSPMVVEVLAAAGVDFAILDMEHSALDLDQVAHCIRAADAAGITPFVRVPGVDASLIKKLLNLGAAGIVLPHANPDNCKALLQAMRFAPEGDRGACQVVRSAGYTRGGWNEYAARTNRELIAIALIEDKPTLDDFETLAAMPGLDVYFIGPTDLSISLGVPAATFDDPILGAALDKVVEVTRRHGKIAMTLIGNNLDGEYGKRVVKRGVQMLALGTDGDLFLDAAKRANAVKG